MPLIQPDTETQAEEGDGKEEEEEPEYLHEYLDVPEESRSTDILYPNLDDPSKFVTE